MLFSLSGILFILNGLLLSVFCHNRFIAYRNNPLNKVTYLYRQASLFVSLALMIYGVASLFTNDSVLISISGSLGLILNCIGFGYFLLIPLYNWLNNKNWILIKYLIFISIGLVAGLLIIQHPHSYIDSFGVIHWKFDPLIKWIAVIQMDVAFLLNIYLLGMNFYRLKKLSTFNTLALIATFLSTGLAGGYQYIGDNTIYLALASIGLYIGISFVFFSVIHGAINRILDKPAQ